MADLLDLFGRALDACARAGLALACALLAAMALLINVEVLGRYFFNFSTLIADEYTGYFFTWLTMASLLWGLRRGDFLAVDAAVRRLGPRARDACACLAALVGLCVALVLLDATWELLAVSLKFGSRSIQPSQTPLWIPQLALPAGFALLALAYLHEILARARAALTGTAAEKAGGRAPAPP